MAVMQKVFTIARTLEEDDLSYLHCLHTINRVVCNERLQVILSNKICQIRKPYVAKSKNNSISKEKKILRQSRHIRYRAKIKLHFFANYSKEI